MNGNAASKESLFECRPGEVVWLWRDDERVRCRDHSFDLMKVIAVICGDMEETTTSERAMNGGKEFCGESAPPMVSPLRPRVGKKQVKGSDTFRRE